MPEPAAIFSVESAGQVYNQTNEFVYFGWNVNHKNNNTDLSVHRGRPAYTQRRMAQLPEVNLELYDRTSALLELNIIRMLRAEARLCCSAASRGARARATNNMTHCAESSTASWLALAREKLHRPPGCVLSGHTYYEDGK